MTSPAPAAKPSHRSAQFSGAAGRSYTTASVWEHTAALSEAQLRVIDQLSQCCAQRPYPTHVSVDDQQRYAVEASEGQAKDSYVGTLEDAVLHNTNQFHKWHTELEAACASETEEKYKRYADLLHSHLHSCEAILTQVDTTLEAFEGLQAQHREVAVKSKALHGSCEALVREKDTLVEFADALRGKLRFFDEFESVYGQFHAAQLSLDHTQFLSLLAKLDDCMGYVAANPQYADAGQYATKFRQLQGRALNAVRSKVQTLLKHAVQQVQASIQEASAASQPPSAPPTPGRKPSLATAGSAGPPVLAEGAEMSLLYVRFRAAAEPNLKGLFKELESRGQRTEYARLLSECHALYCAARLQLISPFVQQRVGEIGSAALTAATRSGCEHLLRVCQQESALFESFFPATSPPPGPAEALAPLMEPLCTLLYDALRPHIVHLQDLDELCELVDILKHEVLGEQVSRRGSGGEALKPMLLRTLADIQARLIYRCQAFIKDEVERYQPSPEDVDYPGKLQRAAEAMRHAGSAAVDGDEHSTDGNGHKNGPAAAAGGDNGAVTVDAGALLYPPLRSTLLALSKLYRAVDARTFGGMATDAVSACTAAIQQASRQVARKAGPLDAQLFLIRHLLFLREQIAPFDVDFSTTDTDLDFSHMREHMRRILAGETSLFTLSSSNAVVKMLGTGGPRVLHYQVDSKKEVEKQLKGVCEAFIMALTKVAVEPLLSFITKVTAVRVTAGASAGGANAKPLREQAFASQPKLQEMVSRVNEALAASLPAAVAKMRLYLANPSTHAILFKPVKSNIVEAHGQIASLLAAEYPAEELTQEVLPLKRPHELAALLDGLC